MMTGRLSVRSGIGFVGPGSNGVFTDEAVGCLPSTETTMADAVKAAGYRTLMVGKVSESIRQGLAFCLFA